LAANDRCTTAKKVGPRKWTALLALFLVCGSGDNFLLQVVCILCLPNMLAIIIIVSLTNNHFTLKIVSTVS
jgi:hypothetical protein